jgi:hypothetical protein
MMAISMPLFTNLDWSRVKEHQTPCALCGRPVTTKPTTPWVYVHDGGGAIVTEGEYYALVAGGAPGEMGAWPIGPDCWRTHPNVRPYAVRPQSFASEPDGAMTVPGFGTAVY